MRALVIGAGVIGCAIAFELRRLGVEVVVVDTHGAVGHGSTSASCGIVRRFYSEPGMIALAHEGAQIWADWGAHLGPIDDDLAVFHRPGMLLLPARMEPWVHDTVTSMGELGVEVEVLSRAELERRFPYFDLASHDPPCSPEDEAFFEPSQGRIEGGVLEVDAGYVVFPSLATQNLSAAARREGATFMLNRRVVEIRKGGGARFCLQLSGGEALEGDVLINAAGPHSAQVNRMAEVRLPLQTRALRRETHTVHNPRYIDGVTPVPVVGDLDAGVYFRPEGRGHQLVVGSADPSCDPLDWVDDADDYHQGLTDTYHQRHVLRLMKRFPEVGMGRAQGISALYDVTVEDWYPIADKTDELGYYVCIGTSGSSFKTSPVLGRYMAELIVHCEGGEDADRSPLPFHLHHIDRALDPRFLSRLRTQIKTSQTVIG